MSILLPSKNIYKSVPELYEIESFAKEHPDIVRLHQLGEVKENSDVIYPIYALEIGSQNKELPTLGVFGGVHGIERIGTQVLLGYLHTLKQRLQWDNDLREQLKNRRIVCIPIVNPWGMAHHRRSNINGVDLMRNAPVDAQKASFLVGGHRISNFLPWYRGSINGPMELESQTLIDYVQEQLFQSKVSIALDLHSGFGVKDQLWYPYAKSKLPFPFLKQFRNLEKLFEQTYPHHIYRIEPQSKHYTTHGDLWDHSLELHEKSQYKHNVFIPITLELGSWIWVKKNPIQIFSMAGLFNPVKEHRYNRTMRRHLYLFDFLLRALNNPQAWAY